MQETVKALTFDVFGDRRQATGSDFYILTILRPEDASTDMSGVGQYSTSLFVASFGRRINMTQGRDT